MHNETRIVAVEFITVAALVALAVFGVIVLTQSGHDDSPVTGALIDLIKVGFGAVSGMALSARNVARDAWRNRSGNGDGKTG